MDVPTEERAEVEPLAMGFGAGWLGRNSEEAMRRKTSLGRAWEVEGVVCLGLCAGRRVLVTEDRVWPGGRGEGWRAGEVGAVRACRLMDLGLGGYIQRGVPIVAQG